jgi:hypothetical protein
VLENPRACIAPDFPHVPLRSESFLRSDGVLDHRGFVAGMFDELGIIDQATPQHPEMGLVTAGHAVNAMVLKGLGLVNQPLALVPRLFQDTPPSRRLVPSA